MWRSLWIEASQHLEHNYRNLLATHDVIKLVDDTLGMLAAID